MDMTTLQSSQEPRSIMNDMTLWGLLTSDSKSTMTHGHAYQDSHVYKACIPLIPQEQNFKDLNKEVPEICAACKDVGGAEY